MDERSELERLKQRQARLEQELSQLAEQLSQFEARLNAPPAPSLALPQIKSVPPPAPIQSKRAVPPPIPVPPIIQPVLPSVPAQAKATEPGSEPTEAKPEPPKSDEFVPGFVRIETPRSEPEPTFAAKESSSKETTFSIPPIASEASAPRASFEMRVGTYWLVRIGIVML